MSVTNASGSVMPPTNGQFRGMAPAAGIFAMSIDSIFGIGGSETSFGPIFSDEYLQEMAARTNANISNNSWHYGDDTDYDIAAASYDAAVRDALPEIPGSHSITYVFAAGNSGGGDDNGGSGSAGSVNSPATAKNVISVGAARTELPRTTTAKPARPTLPGRRLPIIQTRWHRSRAGGMSVLEKKACLAGSNRTSSHRERSLSQRLKRIIGTRPLTTIRRIITSTPSPTRPSKRTTIIPMRFSFPTMRCKWSFKPFPQMT